MAVRDGMKRIASGLALALTVTALSGCAYLRQRRNDFLQTSDLGITTSRTPYLALQASTMGIFSVGAGRFDGTFTGVGGDQTGSVRHYHRGLGLIAWSYDEIGWGEKADPADPNTLLQWHSGPIGWLGYPQRPPSYAFACTHYLHLGVVGVVANFRYLETLDFLLGWTTLDILKDDDKEPGDWTSQVAEPKHHPKWTPKLPF